MDAFLVVVAGFFAVSFLAPASFFVVAVELDESDVVVTDSFLLAHDVIKPAAARIAMDVISDFFIEVWLTTRSVFNRSGECKQLIARGKRCSRRFCSSSKIQNPSSAPNGPKRWNQALNYVFCVSRLQRFDSRSRA